ncbi:MAG: hypothetical protein HC772_07375 [Leptolyngbyaceae cyanobacterium CRU_2_3]|nr:hypothetical protein [Leptolyngbyaceae cyanobacterium CRU_2_3]
MFVHRINQVVGSSDPGYSPDHPKHHLNQKLGKPMKPMTFSTVATLMVAASLPTLASPGAAAEHLTPTFQIAQSSRAEQTCVSAARDRGLRVQDIVSVNEYSGGAEVIMEVRQNRNGSSRIGCDYSSATRDVELYEIEDDYDSSSDNNNNDDNSNWQNQYGNGDVRSRNSAESIAREVVGDQLGIDEPYSSVVKIDTVQRENNNRSWVVEGRANGAPFVVRIRANDGSVQSFQLY